MAGSAIPLILQMLGRLGRSRMSSADFTSAPSSTVRRFQSPLRHGADRTNAGNALETHYRVRCPRARPDRTSPEPGQPQSVNFRLPTVKLILWESNPSVVLELRAITAPREDRLGRDGHSRPCLRSLNTA